MNRYFVLGAFAALMSTTALAENAILENEFVKAGVNETTGTFGSGGSARPGLQYDSTGTSTFPADGEQGDYLTPGSPFDGFTVDVDGTAYTNNNARGTTINGGWDETPTAGSAKWAGSVADVFSMTNEYSLPSGQEYIDITTEITATAPIEVLRFGRFIDPDAMPEAGDTSATDNVIGYGSIPKENLVFSEATVSRYALGLYSTDYNVGAGISSSWSTDPNDYATGGSYEIGTGDHTIGLGWEWTGLEAGDIATASYAYIFGPSAFDAAESAIEGGAGGGVDVLTGDLTDVGSATDAASEPDPEPVITYSDVVDTDRPVLSASITSHTASETKTVQTIAREKTTTVTTPMETITYTDGVETDRTVTDSVITTNVTDPGSFTGRIDQNTTGQVVQSIITRELDFDGLSIVNARGDNKTVGLTLGHTIDTDNGIAIGAGYGRIRTDTTDADVESNVLNLRATNNNVTVGLTHAASDIESNRTIGTFSNKSETKGTDTAINVMYKGDDKVRPIIGYTRGARSIDAHTETGSIQSARDVADSKDYYGYASIGIELDVNDMLKITAIRHTDNTNAMTLNFASDYFDLGVTRRLSDYGNNTSVKAGFLFNF